MRCFFYPHQQVSSLPIHLHLTAEPTLSILPPFFPANAPHKRKTTPERRVLMWSIMASVNRSQPMVECEFGVDARTVREAFNNKTPCGLEAAEKEKEFVDS